MTDLGLEVEVVEKYQSVKGGLEGIVVGHVLTCVPHPDADRLKVTTVDLGNGVPVQIVCGASNVAAGQKVPVATIGTTLYDKEGVAFQIKKGKIRGQGSHGMICAEDELGLGESHDRMMVLDDAIAAGTTAASVFKIENDEVFEIGLTPNRCRCHQPLWNCSRFKGWFIPKRCQSGIDFTLGEQFQGGQKNPKNRCAVSKNRCWHQDIAVSPFREFR